MAANEDVPVVRLEVAEHAAKRATQVFAGGGEESNVFLHDFLVAGSSERCYFFLVLKFNVSQVPTFELAIRRAVSDSTNTAPVLGAVRLTSAEGEVVVASTCLSVTRTETVEAVVEEPVDVVLDQKKLSKIVKRAAKTKRPVEIEALPNAWARVRVGKSEFKMFGHAPADFPETAVSPALAEFDLPTETLLDDLGVARVHACSDEYRVNLHGFALALEGPRLAIVATDGHRLARSYVSEDCGTESFGGKKCVVVTYDAIKPLNTLLKDASKVKTKTDTGKVLEHPTVRVTVRDGRVDFAVAGVTISAKTPNVIFPPYLQVIPDAVACAVKPDAAPLRRALEDATLAAPEKTATTRLDVGRDGEIVVSADNPDFGDFRATVASEVVSDDRWKVETLGANATYLIDALDALGGPTLKVTGGPHDPLRLTSADGRRDVVVMPMRV